MRFIVRFEDRDNGMWLAGVRPEDSFKESFGLFGSLQEAQVWLAYAMSQLLEIK